MSTKIPTEDQKLGIGTAYDDEPFSIKQLEGAIFRVDWANRRSQPTKTKEGGEYSAHVLLCTIKGMVVPIWVRIPTTDYESLRLLHMQGINVYSCSLKEKKDGQRYADRVFAGAKDFE